LRLSAQLPGSLVASRIKLMHESMRGVLNL
jgi:hypothetical protein